MNNEQIKASICLIGEAITRAQNTVAGTKDRKLAEEQLGNTAKVRGIHLLTNFLQNINTIAQAQLTLAGVAKESHALYNEALRLYTAAIKEGYRHER